MRVAAFLFSFLLLLLGSEQASFAAPSPRHPASTSPNNQVGETRLLHEVFEPASLGDFQYKEADENLYYEEVEDDDNTDSPSKKCKIFPESFSSLYRSGVQHLYAVYSASSFFSLRKTHRFILFRSLRI